MNESASFRQTFRVTIDIEATIHASPPDTVRNPEKELYHDALVQQLLSHPHVLRRLQRALAVDALDPVKSLLDVEYGWTRNSEQQLLQSIMADLEPTARAYFSEELDEGVSIYYLGGDAYETTIKWFALTELDPSESK